MNRQRWCEVEGLLLGALEVAPDLRPVWLQEAAAGDRWLVQEVEGLLRSYGPGQSLLERPALSWLTDADWRWEPSIGDGMGPYRLTRLIGRGGMAHVYRAERADRQYEQGVAIKVLATPLLFLPSHHQRFRAERQILADLDHPNVARLLDGGSWEGRPYLVMELIEGRPLDAYCEAERLSIEARLELMIAVCRAVHYAHRHRVIHRDLKPSNILVTAAGKPKLLDFGIAKWLDPKGCGMTRGGWRAMTPAYASPEQILGGPVTAATDTYSLGVLLYELLTGSSPYRASRSRRELAQAVCGQQPLRPSSAVRRRCGSWRFPEAPNEHRRRLRGDLDAIVAMALRKEPGRRYATALELAEDLERHRSHRPVLARGLSWRNQAAKGLRRRRSGVATAASVLGLVVVFALALGRQAAESRREREVAEGSLGVLTELFAEAQEATPAGSLAAHRVLDAVAERAVRDGVSEPWVRRQRLQTLGEIYLGLGLHEEAQELLSASRELGPEPGAGHGEGRGIRD